MVYIFSQFFATIVVLACLWLCEMLDECKVGLVQRSSYHWLMFISSAYIAYVTRHGACHFVKSIVAMSPMATQNYFVSSYLALPGTILGNQPSRAEPKFANGLAP